MLPAGSTVCKKAKKGGHEIYSRKAFFSGNALLVSFPHLIKFGQSLLQSDLRWGFWRNSNHSLKSFHISTQVQPMRSIQNPQFNHICAHLNQILGFHCNKQREEIRETWIFFVMQYGRWWWSAIGNPLKKSRLRILIPLFFLETFVILNCPISTIFWAYFTMLQNKILILTFSCNVYCIVLYSVHIISHGIVVFCLLMKKLITYLV